MAVEEEILVTDWTAVGLLTGKKSIHVEGMLPSRKHEVVFWFEEDPENGLIKAFIDLRKPIGGGGGGSTKNESSEGFVLEREFSRMLPGAYKRVQLFVEGVLFGEKLL